MGSWYPLVLVVMFVLWFVQWVRQGFRLRGAMSVMRRVLKESQREAHARGWTWRRRDPGVTAWLTPELFGGVGPAQRGVMTGEYEGREVTVAVLGTSGPTVHDVIIPWLVVRLAVPEYAGTLRLYCSGEPPHYWIGGENSEDGTALFGLAGEGLFTTLIGLGHPVVDVRVGHVMLVVSGERCAVGDLTGRLNAASQVAHILAGSRGS
jgi:hypothetical protein